MHEIPNKRHFLRPGAGTAASLLLVAGIVAPTWADDGNPNPGVIPPFAYAFGKSYGEWSAEWWKWELKLPASDHPAFSTDGEDCDVGQSGKVWFLTSALTTEVPTNEFNTIVRESCSVPTGKAIFFPIINIECSSIEAAPFFGASESEQRECADSFVNGPNATITDLSVTVDGMPLENIEAYRVQSPQVEFGFGDPNDNLLGVDCSVEDCDEPTLVSDGYWIMLAPLSWGVHTIEFTGSFRDTESDDLFFGLDVTYELTVIPGRWRR